MRKIKKNIRKRLQQEKARNTKCVIEYRKIKKNIRSEDRYYILMMSPFGNTKKDWIDFYVNYNQYTKNILGHGSFEGPNIKMLREDIAQSASIIKEKFGH